MEHVANPELLVPLPLSNVTHSDLAGQYPSSALVLTDATQTDQLATPPPVNFASQKNEKIQPKEHQVWIIRMYFAIQSTESAKLILLHSLNVSRPPVLKKFHREEKGRTVMIH
jgi:hypothetical protein